MIGSTNSNGKIVFSRCGPGSGAGNTLAAWICCIFLPLWHFSPVKKVFLLKKAMFIVAVAAFMACLIMVIPVQPPTPQETPVPPVEAPGGEAQPQPPAPDLKPSPRPQPKPTALPLSPSDTQFYAQMFLPVETDDVPNKELQKYRSPQVRIDGRRFLLTAEETEVGYVSGRAESMFGWLYGSMTFRIRLAKDAGLFPAVWMLPARSGLMPEVDIFEQIGREESTIYGVSHYQLPGMEEPDNDYFRYQLYGAPEECTVRFDWTEEALTWTVDGQVIYEIREHVPQIPMYLILNLAIGGVWCGPPTAETVFPATMEVEILDFQPENIFTR